MTTGQGQFLTCSCLNAAHCPHDHGHRCHAGAGAEAELREFDLENFKPVLLIRTCLREHCSRIELENNIRNHLRS